MPGNPAATCDLLFQDKDFAMNKPVQSLLLYLQVTLGGLRKISSVSTPPGPPQAAG